MNYIDTSIFELFEIGPGPSSSHTIGPIKAANNFINCLKELPIKLIKEITKIEVYLYGSLSTTGMGHGTHKAILAGLLGYLPPNIDTAFFRALFNDLTENYFLTIDNISIKFNFNNIHFKHSQYNSPYQNTLIFKAYSKEQIIFEREYYSIGGGFIKYKGELETSKKIPLHFFSNMNELKILVNEKNKSIPEIILENEINISQLNKKEIYKKLYEIVEVMFNSVNNGLQKEGILPGSIKLQRKALLIYKGALMQRKALFRNMGILNAYAFATSEENADSEIIVTAPTSGSCGIIPAIIYYLHYNRKINLNKIVCGLLTAAAIGLIIKQNASLSGAEVGCQGEIGVASAMAAALLCQVYQKSAKIIENAAEIALEHHLGLTCDPIGGYVQIPCIERNAVGAIKAYNAFVIASLVRQDMHKVSLDSTIKSMYETGKDMLKKYKETARGGLAVCFINC
jgi:L-serine dehydratase